MNSSEASESDPNKKNSVPGVSSRLLKGTSASLAKSGVTPTLTRKFGSPKTQKTPTIGPRYGEIGYKYNSGRKLAQNVSKTGPKFATSSAKKKVVMNSTSEAENVVPTDWDASAIVPPGQVQSNKVPEVMTTTAKTAMKPNKELKLRTAAKAVIRGPLKALPNMPRGVETTTKKSVFPGRGVETTTKKPGFLGTVTKRSQLSSVSSASNSFACEDDLALYDEYLLSELMLANIKKNCQDGRDQAKKDLSQLWSALESIRDEVTSLEMANDEMKILCDYAKETSENNSKLKEATESIIKLKSEVKDVVRALENTRHTLPIEGTKADNIESSLAQAMPKLDKMSECSKIHEKSKEEMVSLLQKLNSSLEISRENSHESQKNLKQLKSQALKEASMKLSLKQIEDPNKIDNLVDTLITVPPKPKLIDF